MATAARKKERAPKPGSLHTGKMLNRSRGGNAAIFLILFLIALFMGLPLFYSVASAFQPPEELYLFPPRFYVVNPTFDNFKKLGLILPLCMPLLLTSVSRIHDVASAAEMRGFLLRTRESQSRPYRFKIHDLLAALIAAALVTLGVLL